MGVAAEKSRHLAEGLGPVARRAWLFLRRLPRPTRWGWYFLLAAAGMFVAGGSTDETAFVLLSCLPFGLLAVNFVVVVLNLRGLRAKRWMPRDAHAGEPVEVVLDVENRGRLLPRMALAVQDVLPPEAYRDEEQLPLMAAPPGKSLHVGYTLGFTRRGRYELPACVFSSAFPFGLVRHTRTSTLQGEITVYPRPARLSRRLEKRLIRSAQRPGESWQRRKGEEEIFGVREYRPGENVRRIHWPSTARLGTPMILEMEGYCDARFALALDTSPCGDPATLRTRLENLVSLCAGIVWFLTAQGVGFRFAACEGGALVSRYDRGDRHYRAIMEYLALAGLSDRPLSEWIGSVGMGKGGETGIVLSMGTREHAEAALPRLNGAVVIGATDRDFSRNLRVDALGRRSVSAAELAATVGVSLLHHDDKGTDEKTEDA